MANVGGNPICWVLQPVHGVARDLLEQAGFEIAEGIDVPAARDRVRALVSRNAPITAELMDLLPALAVIAKHGTGLDAVDLDAAEARAIPVVYTPGANAQSVAEHALMLMLAVAKRARPADRAVRSGDFSYKFRADFRELAGLRLGIVGFGESGQRLAGMARGGLGMRVAAHSPSVADELFRDLGVERLGFERLLATSDVVSIHVPARPATEPLFGAAALAAMKPGAILVNTARGGAVDEQALAAALTSGHLAGAGLDVFAPEPPASDNPLLAMDNVVLSPHVAGSTGAALERMARGVVEQIIDVMQGRRPAHLANPGAWDRANRARE